MSIAHSRLHSAHAQGSGHASMLAGCAVRIMSLKAGLQLLRMRSYSFFPAARCGSVGYAECAQRSYIAQGTSAS